MSSIAFSSALSSAGAVTATSKPAQRNNTSTAGTATGSDTVSLSPTAQATALQQQGLTVNEIASFLGLTTATVDGYLDLTTTSAAATTSGGGGGGGAPAGGASQAGAAHAAAAGATTAASSTAASNKSASPPAAAESSKVQATPQQQ